MEERKLKSKRRRHVSHKRPGGRRFYMWYGIGCAVLIFLMTIGVGIFYDFIRTYEECLPEHVADLYINSLDGASFTALIAPEIEARASGFETEDAIGAILAEAISGGVTYTKAVGTDDPAYDVYCGGRLMRLTLTASKRGRYGFDNYRVAGAEIYPEWIAERFCDVTIIVPEGADVTVNGIPVGADRKTATEYESAVLSSFERTRKLVTYEIRGVFGEASVSAELRGKPLTLSCRESDNTYYSDYALPALHEYTVKAPADATVTVNGQALGKSEITGTETVSGLGTEFEPDTAPELSIYSLTGLIDTPEVTVTLAGETLTPDESDDVHGNYTYPESYKRNYTVRVPKGMKLYCNGIEVSRTYITGDGGKYSAPDGVSVKVTETSEIYTVGLYGDPVFTVSAAKAVYTADNDARSWVFYPYPGSSEEKTIREISEDFTNRFIYYAYQGFRNTKANLAACLELSLDGSNAYDLISKTIEFYKYNSPYTIEKLNMEVAEIIKYSDACISVKVDFEAHGNFYGNKKDDVGTYSMLWQKKDGKWLLTEFSM